MVGNADKAITKELVLTTLKEDLAKIDPKTEEMRQHIAVLTQMYQYSDDMRALAKDLKKGVDYFTDQVNYNLNKDFEGRTAVGDNPYDFNSRGYGNGNPRNSVPTEDHGTYVAGIIAGNNNGLGVNGVANNVEIRH